MFNNYYDPTTFTLKLIKPRMVVCDGRGRERGWKGHVCVCVWNFDLIIFGYLSLPHPSTHPSSVAMVDLSRILRRPQQQARRVYDKPARERHFLSIICSVLSSIFLIMALALKVWASGHNDQCSYVFGLTQVYLVEQNTNSRTFSSKPTLNISSR